MTRDEGGVSSGKEEEPKDRWSAAGALPLDTRPPTLFLPSTPDTRPFLLSAAEANTVDEFFNWLSNQFIGRVDGPLKFRLILQPAVAVFFVTRDGLKDARRGSVPYTWAIITEPSRRMELILDGLKVVAKVFVFATVMDLVYQYLVLGWVYPLAALSIAFILAFIPYLLIRGPVDRIARAGNLLQKERTDK